MLTLRELERFLTEQGCDYSILSHDAPVYTMQDASRYFDISQSAPVFVLQSERGLLALLSSSERGRIDCKKLARELGLSKLKLAGPEQILRETGCRAGEIPLVGHGLPCVFDNRLLKHAYIYGGTGDACRTLRISPLDVRRLNQVLACVD